MSIRLNDVDVFMLEVKKRQKNECKQTKPCKIITQAKLDLKLVFHSLHVINQSH